MSYIYGKHSVQECIKKFPEYIKTIFYVDSVPEALSNINDSIKYSQTYSSDLHRLLGLRPHDNHQGIALQLTRSLDSLLKIDIEDLVSNAIDTRQNLIFLPHVHDIHNLAAITRACVVLGNIAGIIYPAKSSPPLNAHIGKVSAGACFHMQYAQFNSVKQALNIFRASNISIIAIENRETSQNIASVNLSKYLPLVITIGAEDKGVPFQVSEQAQFKLHIQQTDIIDSLNMSVATGIVLHEINKNL